jgi:hypothetical protein
MVERFCIGADYLAKGHGEQKTVLNISIISGFLTVVPNIGALQG